MVYNLIKYYLDKYDFDIIIMFSDTAKYTKDYEFIDKNLIFKTDEMEDKIKKILQIQEKNLNKNKIVNILVILDDVKEYSLKINTLLDILGTFKKLVCLGISNCVLLGSAFNRFVNTLTKLKMLSYLSFTNSTYKSA